MKDNMAENCYISVIMPCLHTMCSSCMAEMITRDIRKCHICRGEIEDVIEYMGGVYDSGDDDPVIYRTMIVRQGVDGSKTIDLTMD